MLSCEQNNDDLTMTIKYHKYLTYITHAVMLAILLLAEAVSVHAFDLSHYSDTSKLATGKWVKIAVNESGIYQITASDASRWGFSDLSRVKVFGYGAMQLSETLTPDLPDDLPQVPVVRTGDRILFYAQGPLKWEYNVNKYLQIQHPYATRGYYFVTDDDRYADKQPTQSQVAANGTVVNTIIGRLYHEEELVNPGETGRRLLGEDFSVNKSQSFSFNLPGLVDGSKVNVYTRFAAKTIGGKTSISFKYNGNNIAGSNDIPAVDQTDHNHHHYNAILTSRSFNLSGTKDLTYTVTCDPKGTLFLVRLDYITVNYERSLDLLGDSELLFGLEFNRSAQYELSGASSGTHVWDVTTPYQPIEMNLSIEGNKARFSSDIEDYRELVAFNENGTFPSPDLMGNINNQSIHGNDIPDMIILAPSEYLTYAQQIADMHVRVDSMRVLVLDHTKVFNEFSSGTPDAMGYRLLCKYFLDRGADSQGHKLGYLLLFGNGYCDNRQLSSAARAIPYPKLLVWESEESEEEQKSYTSDDFFGLLQDGANMKKRSRMEIAVGRIPARSTSDAGIAVNKIVKYVTQDDYGSWKNSMLNVADDGDTGGHWIHGEEVIKVVASNGGENTNFNRVFLDNFEEKSDGSGSKYPDARRKMYKTLNEGVLWWNYSGHGGPSGWTNDGLLVPNDLAQNLFYAHQPFLFAATCEFSRHDGSSPSGGESMFFNPNGGVVTLICPPRLVYMSSNKVLNVTVARKMYDREKNGLLLRVGDIINYGKNNEANSDYANSNALRYHIYGDPAIRPAMPKYNAVVDDINGKAIDKDNMPVFQARQTMTITGHIENLEGIKQSDFNGQIESTLFDCEKSVSFTYSYMGRDPKTGQTIEKDSTLTYEERQNKLAINVTRVTNGEFTINITIPSEVTADYDNYRPSLVSLYAYDSEKKSEATGSCEDFYIYGYDDSIVADTIGPDISYMGLNSLNFKDGDNVNESPLFIATVSDESGINFSNAGIGHNMTLTLDGATTYSDVSSYYTAIEADKGSAGNINYALSDLSNGQHNLKLKVWDVFNNSSEKTINFNVMNGLKPEIDEVKAFPNPAATTTSFIITHNRPEATVSITIEVYNLMGQRVWSTTQSGRSTMFSSFPITWDLSDYSGSRLPRGIYIYRATISTDGHQESTKSKKLAITAP